MLKAGCTNTNRARKHQNSQNRPGRGKTCTWPTSQVPLPLLSKVTNILYQINAFNQTADPILTCVALETGGGSRKEVKPV